MAFVPNRWINENVVLAQEIVHRFKHTRKKKGFVGVKLDFQKAYIFNSGPQSIWFLTLFINVSPLFNTPCC